MRPRPVHLWVCLPTFSWYLGDTLVPFFGPFLAAAFRFVTAFLGLPGRFLALALSKLLTSAADKPISFIIDFNFFRFAACFLATLSASLFLILAAAACRFLIALLMSSGAKAFATLYAVDFDLEMSIRVLLSVIFTPLIFDALLRLILTKKMSNGKPNLNSLKGYDSSQPFNPQLTHNR